MLNDVSVSLNLCSKNRITDSEVPVVSNLLSIICLVGVKDLVVLTAVYEKDLLGCIIPYEVALISSCIEVSYVVTILLKGCNYGFEILIRIIILCDLLCKNSVELLSKNQRRRPL